jgi:hypothetical protein
LIIASVVISGTDRSQFKITNTQLPIVIQENMKDTLFVTFTPTSVGNKSASIILKSNDLSQISTAIALHGVGVAANITTDPSSSLDFGNVNLGLDSVQTIVVRNNGTASLSINNIVIEDTNCFKNQVPLKIPLVIMPGCFENIQYRFSPKKKGDAETVLRISSDALNEPEKIILLKGSGIEVTSASYPDSFGSISLSPNYPNPFGAMTGYATSISYQLSAHADVQLHVYNTLGQKAATLVNQLQSAGAYTETFNAGSIPAGMYTAVLTATTRAGSVTRRITMSLVR